MWANHDRCCLCFICLFIIIYPEDYHLIGAAKIAMINVNLEEDKKTNNKVG